MRKRIIFVLLIIYTVILLSCKLNVNKNDVEYDDYNLDIVWKKDLSLENNLYEKEQYGQYLYCFEKDNNENECISKTDLITSETVWKSNTTLLGIPCSPPLKADNCVYALTELNSTYIIKLYIFSDITGELLASIKLSSDDESYSKYRGNGKLFYEEGKLYWIRKKLCCFDLSSVNLSITPFEDQVIEPDILWFDEDYNLKVLLFPIVDNHIIYFQTYDYNGYNNELPTKSKLIAYNLKDEKVLWCHKCTKLYGYGMDNMIIVDDRLYVIEQGIGCFDLQTGKCYHESTQTHEDLLHNDAILGGAFSDGIAYHNGKFFYTNTASWSSSTVTGIPQKYIHNIICLDAKTLKIVWGQLPKGSGSQSACPTVMNGKVFVPLWLGGLCVLDEKNGKILGINKDIVNYGDGKSFYYNDLAYFLDYSHCNEDDLVTLVAIKP